MEGMVVAKWSGAMDGETAYAGDGLNHPADKLALVRQRIKALQTEEAELKAACLALPEEDRMGRYCEVRVTEVSRSTIDTKALAEVMGTDVLGPFTKVSQNFMVTIRDIDGGQA